MRMLDDYTQCELRISCIFFPSGPPTEILSVSSRGNSCYMPRHLIFLRFDNPDNIRRGEHRNATEFHPTPCHFLPHKYKYSSQRSVTHTHTLRSSIYHPYVLTPWCRAILEKLTGLQLVKKFPTFHGTRRFITALTSVHHLPLSWASPIQSTYPHPSSWRSVLILSIHLRLGPGLPSGLFPSGFPTKTLYTPLSSPICAPCPDH